MHTAHRWFHMTGTNGRRIKRVDPEPCSRRSGCGGSRLSWSVWECCHLLYTRVHCPYKMFVITHCVLYCNVSPEFNSRGTFQYVRSSSTKEGVSLNGCLHLTFVNVTQSFHTHSFSPSQNFTHSGYFIFFIIILVNGHNNKKQLNL